MKAKHALGLMLLATACLPFSMSGGKMGQQMLSPWALVTSYAYWDLMERVPEEGEVRWKEREEEEGGGIINVLLYGFVFNPNDDRSKWGAVQWDNFIFNYTQSPSLQFSIRNADKLKAGDTLEWEPRDLRADGGIFVGDAGSGPPQFDPEVVGVTYRSSPPQLNSASEYPDAEVPYGGRRSAEVTINAITEQPGPTAMVSGVITYKIERGDGDPDDVAEGEITVNFSAPLLGERFAKCNEYLTAYRIYGIYAGFYGAEGTGCGRLDANAE